MPEPVLTERPEFKADYVAHERQQRVNTGRVASALVVFLMPVGIVLDYFVYPDEVLKFLLARVFCAGLALLLWHLHRTAFGQAHYRWLGLPIALLPAVFICWMIFVKEGPASPYYAGLNLILLAVSVVVRWDFAESLMAVGAVMLMYLAACLLSGARQQLPVMFNNFYFISLTGIIVVTGNHLFNRLRFREFVLRYELNENRAKLEESNRKLMELDEAKGRFFANISHELRTPLCLLIAPLETIINRFSRAFDTDTKELLGTMHSNGMRLLKLINDLLDLVRLESGRLGVKTEPMEMVDFARGLASSVRQVANDKRITLETKVDPELGWIQADRDKLEKIVLNLLFNALKFTP
ncbi:MAG TPA: histidine kinase dimerization/phospho-acceptor domain-containing protein, partial [Verrucomicrobiae bacterium]|nr:histidine kinase dimerization/phospho-acceptor domain-containing protein [Verrucomicrobiae bacterium]